MHHIAIILLGAAAAASRSLSVRLAASDETSPELGAPIGDLWSSAAMTDENLQANRSDGWLLPANQPEIQLLGWSALNGTTTNPVVKRMSTVRILGGWGPGSLGPREPGWPDVVWRLGGPNGTGAVQYRWEALFDRLDPMVGAGIHPTFVLDNVPFALAGKDASLGIYGQTMGPRNTIEDYHAMVFALVGQITARYGTDVVRSTFRFRVATEPNTDPGHWQDTVEEWNRMYDAAADAVTTALPGAVVGPANFCPFALRRGCRGTLDTVVAPIVDHIAAGRNTWTNQTGRTPIAWLSSSFYGSSGPDSAPHLGYDPSRAAVEAGALVKLAQRHPARLAALPLYFHEFGMLGSPTRGSLASEPGAFGGAWRLAASSAAAGAGVSQIYRWGATEWLRGGPSDVLLLHSNLFLSGVAHAVGAAGTASATTILTGAGPGTVCAANGTVNTCSGGAPCCVLPIAGDGARGPAEAEPTPNDVVASGLVTVIQPSSTGAAACPDGVKGPGVRPLCPGDVLVLVSTFATGHNATDNTNVTVSVPGRPWWGGVAPRAAQVYELNQRTSVFDAIMDEAGRHEGWLAFHDGATRRLDDMLTHAGMAGIAAQSDRWRSMQEVLFSPAQRPVSVSKTGEGVDIVIAEMMPHSVVAVVLRA